MQKKIHIHTSRNHRGAWKTDSFFYYYLIYLKKLYFNRMSCFVIAVYHDRHVSYSFTPMCIDFRNKPSIYDEFLVKRRLKSVCNSFMNIEQIVWWRLNVLNIFNNTVSYVLYLFACRASLNNDSILPKLSRRKYTGCTVFWKTRKYCKYSTRTWKLHCDFKTLNNLFLFW